MRKGSLSGNGASSAELTRVTSGEQAARHIRLLIFEGALPPGSRIAQDEIAQTLGISRIPLREALIALEREGWVRIVMHRGAFVNPLDQRSLLDHYSMLGLVYGFAARRAVSRGGPSVHPRLAAILHDLREQRDPGLAGDLLRTFHEVVFEAAQSPRMRVLLRTIPSLIPTDIFTTIPKVVEIERPAVERIANAVRAHDGETAAATYAGMMDAVGSEVAALFRKRRLFSAPTEVADAGETASASGLVRP